MQRSNIFYSLIIVLCFSAQTFGQKFVNEFLNIGVGARNQGMFGSTVASVSDGTAAYYNVAGLTGIKSNLHLNAMHSRWFGGIANFDYVTLAKRLNTDNNAVASISVIRLGVDNIPNTLNLIGADGSIDVSRVTPFSTSDLAGFLSYAQNVSGNEDFSIGASAKIIRRSIGNFGSSWGVGADVGVQYKMGNLRFGLSARDITTTVNAWSFTLEDEEKQVFVNTNNDIPLSSTEITLPRLVLGSAYMYETSKFSLLGEIDLNISTDGTKASLISTNNFNIDPSLGLEFGYAEKVFVRAGLGNMQSVINPNNTANRTFEIQPNIGVGLKLGRLRIDYALANQGSVNGALISHIISGSIDFVPRS
jgi:hypothetical protein